jgi:hypothetical protein
MTIFASAPPINDDPTPWLDSRGLRFRIKHGDRYGTTKWSPRPGFDRPRAHEANPILVEFRERENPKNIYALSQWIMFIGEGWDGSICQATTPQIDHARKVLVRLAAFSK